MYKDWDLWCAQYACNEYKRSINHKRYWGIHFKRLKDKILPNSGVIFYLPVACTCGNGYWKVIKNSKGVYIKCTECSTHVGPYKTIGTTIQKWNNIIQEETNENIQSIF